MAGLCTRATWVGVGSVVILLTGALGLPGVWGSEASGAQDRRTEKEETLMRSRVDGLGLNVNGSGTATCSAHSSSAYHALKPESPQTPKPLHPEPHFFPKP